MIQRSKKLKEFFEDLEEKEKMGIKFCKSNWHFLSIFESFLYGLTRLGEINKEFNKLTKKTVDKIEAFIREKVMAHLDYHKNEKNLQGGIFFNF